MQKTLVTYYSLGRYYEITVQTVNTRVRNMPIFFIRHHKDKRAVGFIATKSESENIEKAIDRIIAALRTRANPNNRKDNTTDKEYEKIKKTFEMWRASRSSGRLSEFEVYKLLTQKPNHPKNIVFDFNNRKTDPTDGSRLLVLSRGKLTHKGVALDIEKLTPTDKPVSRQQYFRKIFSIGLKDQKFRFWFTMSNEDVPRTCEQIVRIGIHYMCYYRSRLRKKRDWELNEERSIELDRRFKLCEKFIVDFRNTIVTDANRFVIGADQIGLRSASTAVAGINDEIFSKTFINDEGSPVTTTPESEAPPVSGMDALQAVMGWGRTL